MKGIKKIFNRINIKEFRLYLFFTILFMVTIIIIGSIDLTKASYESNNTISASPDIAFFVVGVESQTGHIKLEEMVPRNEPYLYTFSVNNFQNGRRANVDLTYTIEIITTTNMPLNFKVFKGNDMVNDQIDSTTITTDSNGVYFKHLTINDINAMSYQTNCTDTYTLWVQFPKVYEYNSDEYAGIIDLVDIKINAEQVV